MKLNNISPNNFWIYGFDAKSCKDFASLQILLLEIIDEYVSAVLTQLRNMPLVEEKERINF